MRFHVVNLPHTQTTKDYSACAYTQKVRKFCDMMMARGHEVYLYAGEDNAANCTEFISCITKEELSHHGFYGPDDYLKINFNAIEPWHTFNKEVIEQMMSRVAEKDFICLITSYPAEDIAKAFPGNMAVEFGIGYKATFAKYRVFESHAWRNFVYGSRDEDGQFFDETIPNYFEGEDFICQEKKDDYYLFIGRLTEKKGYRIAQQVCEKLGKRLIVAGPGDFDGYGEYVGVVSPDRRAELMGKATAVFVPTTYIAPFEGVHIEAMLCGTPVITTDFGVFTETVQNGINGFRCSTFREFMNAAEDVKALYPISIYYQAHSKYSTEPISLLYEQYFEKLMTLWDGGFYA